MFYQFRAELKLTKWLAGPLWGIIMKCIPDRVTARLQMTTLGLVTGWVELDMGQDLEVLTRTTGLNFFN